MPPNPYMMNHQRQAMGMPPMQPGTTQPETFQMTQPGMPSAVNPQQGAPLANSAQTAQPQVSIQAMSQAGASPNTGAPPNSQPNLIPPQQPQPQAVQGPPQLQQQQSTGTPAQQAANQIAQGLKNSSFSPDMLQVS